MRRWKYPLAAAGILLAVGWGMYKIGWIVKNSDDSVLGRPIQVKMANPMETPAGWRYRQNQPHHWRYIMLQQ